MQNYEETYFTRLLITQISQLTLLINDKFKGQ